MIQLFLIKLTLSFIVGGGYIAFTIWISERFGSKIGGLLIGLPSTLLVSLLFIVWTQNISASVAALPIVPAAIAANSLFLAAFIFLYKYGKVLAFWGAISLWFILTFPLVFFFHIDILTSLIVSCFFFGLTIYLFREIPHRKLPRFTSTKREFLFRVLFAGSVVAIAVFLAKVLGPLWGGLFASFPAAFSSSLLILERKHGIDFTASVAKTMPYGSMGNVIFVITFFFLVPVMGIVAGIITAYLAAFTFAIVINKVI